VKAGSGLYEGTIGGIVDLAKAIPGFYGGYLKTLWRIRNLPQEASEMLLEDFLAGDSFHIEAQIDLIVKPVAQTFDQADRLKSMLMVLFGDKRTMSMLGDFAQRYWDATHRLGRTEIGATAASDIVVTLLLAIMTVGVGAAANVAAKAPRLAKLAKLLEKLTGILKSTGPLHHLPTRELPGSAAATTRGGSKPPSRNALQDGGMLEVQTPQNKPATGGPNKAGDPDRPATDRPADTQAVDDKVRQRSAASEKLCTSGDPVNSITGEVVLSQSDFVLPGRISVDWTRRYGSNSTYSGLLGKGWQTPADARLALEDGLVVFYDGNTGSAVFKSLPTSAPIMEAANGAMLATLGHGYAVTLKSGTCYEFAAALDNHRVPVSRISDSCGNSLSFVRAGADLNAIEDSAGRRIDITCEDGRIVQINRQDRLLVRYAYRQGQLVGAVDPSGNTRRYDYENGRLSMHRNRNQLRFCYQYDPQGRCTRAFGDNGLYDYKFQYLPLEPCTRVTDSLGQCRHYYRDKDNLPTRVIDPTGASTGYTFDAQARLVAVTDALERTTHFEWDKHGQLTRLTRPGSERTHYQYDPMGNLTAIIDPAGGASAYSYDEKGRLVTAVSPGGLRQSFEWDAEDNLLLYTDAAGHQTRFAYTGLNEPARRTNPDGTHVEYHYDTEERLTGVTNETRSLLAN
jgi:YD repeat-containing protein